jgi:hypothetical protein
MKGYLILEKSGKWYPSTFIRYMHNCKKEQSTNVREQNNNISKIGREQEMCADAMVQFRPG